MIVALPGPFVASRHLGRIATPVPRPGWRNPVAVSRPDRPRPSSVGQTFWQLAVRLPLLDLQAFDVSPFAQGVMLLLSFLPRLEFSVVLP